MSNFTTVRQSNPGNGLKREELLQSQSPDVHRTYFEMLSWNDEFRPSIRSNDVASKYRAACAQLVITPAQRVALEHLAREMGRIEESIDPALLNFTIDQSPDDDVVLHHGHAAGISSLVIHEDGLVAFSFIARRASGKADELTFHETANVDWEGLALHFLVGQGQ